MVLPTLERFAHVWIENRNAPEDSGAPEWNFGRCLWSPARNRSGGDSYRLMREVQPGDLVLHLLRKRWDDGIDEKRLCGYSVVDAACEELAQQPPAPGEWGGRGRYYRVPLREFTPIPEPISIAKFGELNAAAIHEEAVEGRNYPFTTYGNGVRVAQGRYIARCTPLLYQLFAAADPASDGASMKEQGLELLAKLDTIPREVLSYQSASKFDPGSEYPAKKWVADITGLESNEVVVKFATGGRIRHVTGESRPAKLGVFILEGALSDRFIDANLPNIGPRRRFDHALVIERVQERCTASAVIGSLADPTGGVLHALFPDAAAHDVSSGLRSTGSSHLNTVLYGPPGTGKTYRTVDRALELCGVPWETREEAEEQYRSLVAARRIQFVTFHQSFTYEDFVEGIRPDIQGGQLTYAVRPGVFKELCDLAEPSKEPFVLIIDEINRANVSKVFGELITLLEPEKRLGGREEKKVVPPYSRKEFGVPPNLFIVATMNSADRSVASIDLALRRRFSFIEMMPESERIRERGPVEDFDVAALLDAINRRVEFLLDRDHTIGHSYFMELQDLDDLGEVLRERIIPLLQEYFHGDLSKVAAVLGCGFDEEDGRSTNPSPIIVAELVVAGEAFGPDSAFDDRVRARLNDGFYKARGKDLLPYLNGIVSA